MLKIDLHTLPSDFSSIQQRLLEIQQMEVPSFAIYHPDYQRLFGLAGKYAGISNFVVIGRGGSVSGFRALYECLARYHTTKRVFVIDTLDPSYIDIIRKKCLPDDTLVIVISKSGNTVDVVEDFLCFQEYRKVVITENEKGALSQYAKLKELEFVPHPLIGGRFSMGTECALLPAALIYIDVKSVVGGMQAVFRQCHPTRSIDTNPALRLAASLYLAEKQGFTEVYAPIYSKLLCGTAELWTQLMHESVCKEGKGQTFLFMEAPECQHHTNQKFFGGPRRMLGVFTRVEHPEPEFIIPEDHQLSGLHVKDLPFTALMGGRLSDALYSEYHGVQRAADAQKIPNASIAIDVLNPGTFGELAAFWMYVAVYSAWLRGVDAFNQPGVEQSKNFSLDERKRRANKPKPFEA
ncbi:hypothetical protein GOV07_03215 [Candidatus Woesearchaeota archaeon]|nr:hypothetical protein [Candidatus Woesearchaeota archaeon]